jgi:hypothetical protein
MAANLHMTVTNLTATAINTPIVGGAGVSPDAQGGSVFMPLPYPFSHVTLGANGGGSDSKTLPVHVEDFQYKSVPWLPMEPSREWAALLQKGIVSVSFGAGYVANTAEIAQAKSEL